eukprot:gnl/Ergobibamus_cyprinoides/2771.p2 GENE.gnl/Ergobibamus_cyprinoides/2771~~gnl/Ergobibamus_cyprinoides/2771.p2  ORF type:complete len:153 (-),score=34.43 gnl/Ergobibamus_cyprinoides/2771:155-613(-)
MVEKASSTLVAALADVSRKGMPRESANSLATGYVNGLAGGQVALVADEQLDDVLAGVAVNLLQPELDVLERLELSAVVDDNNAVSTPVVRRGDCPEALLAGRIPDLELDGLGVKLDCLDLEVDANGRDVRLGVSVIGKAKKKAGLADAGIAE